MRISDWSSDVCSSDLRVGAPIPAITKPGLIFVETVPREISDGRDDKPGKPHAFTVSSAADPIHAVIPVAGTDQGKPMRSETIGMRKRPVAVVEEGPGRSEEHTSELQSLMRISYAVFCLKKKKTHLTRTNT